jgi:hypothetical protein
LPRHGQLPRQLGKQLRVPGAGGDDDRVRPLASFVRFHPHAGRVLDHGVHLRADAQPGAPSLGYAERRMHRRLGTHDSGVRLECADRVVGERKPGEAGLERSRVECLDPEAPALARGERPLHDGRVGRPRHQHAAAVEQGGARLALEGLEASRRVPQQRHVVGMLEVGVTEDARVPVARAPLVRRRESLEAEDAGTSLGGRAQRGAADRAGADDDDIPGIHVPAERSPTAAVRKASPDCSPCNPGSRARMTRQTDPAGCRAREVTGRA